MWTNYSCRNSDSKLYQTNCVWCCSIRLSTGDCYCWCYCSSHTRCSSRYHFQFLSDKRSAIGSNFVLIIIYWKTPLQWKFKYMFYNFCLLTWWPIILDGFSQFVWHEKYWSCNPNITRMEQSQSLICVPLHDSKVLVDICKAKL